jgi:hypothetical protein
MESDALNSDVARIQAMNWRELQSLWKQLEEGVSNEWAPGKALEHLVLRAFELDGANVSWPYRVALQGQEIEQIDGAVFCEGISCLIECKDTASPVNIEPIAKLRNQLLRRPAGVLGAVFSRSGFTEPAQTLAQFLAPHAVLLYSGEEIGYLLSKEYITRSLTRKYQYCVEYGLPTFDSRVEEHA